MPIEPSTFDSSGAMNGEMFHVKQLLRRREKGADAPGGHAIGLPDYARVSPTGFSLGETSTCQHWTSVRCGRTRIASIAVGLSPRLTGGSTLWALRSETPGFIEKPVSSPPALEVLRPVSPGPPVLGIRDRI